MLESSSSVDSGEALSDNLKEQFLDACRDLNDAVCQYFSYETTNVVRTQRPVQRQDNFQIGRSLTVDVFETMIAMDGIVFDLRATKSDRRPLACKNVTVLINDMDVSVSLIINPQQGKLKLLINGQEIREDDELRSASLKRALTEMQRLEQFIERVLTKSVAEICKRSSAAIQQVVQL